MSRSFDSVALIKSVGAALVAAFEAGGLATTPGLIGSSREVPVRQQLSNLLPRGMGIGSGCVIDSFGNTSRQMDVILYEKEICPAFVLNQDPSSTFYPCEGVIAVGEVKSTMGSGELEDVFKKIESVKKLRRFTRESSAPRWKYVAVRNFGSLISAATSAEGGYDQESKSTDQIYGFGLAGRVALSTGSLAAKFIDLAATTTYPLSPNLLVGLDGCILCPLSVPPDRANPVLELSATDANYIYCVNHPGKSFSLLLGQLQKMYTMGRTVEALAFDKYFGEEAINTLPNNGTLRELPC